MTAEIEVHGGGKVDAPHQRRDGAGVREAAARRRTPTAKKLIKDGKLLIEGYISLQAESHPVEFRKVELLNLVGCQDKKAKNYKSYFEKDDRSSCRYQ